MNQQIYKKSTNSYTLVIDIQERSVNTQANTSEVFYYFKIDSTKYDFNHMTRIRVYINDRYVYDDTRKLSVPTYSSTYLATGTVTVPHDSDGNKRCEIFAELVFENGGKYYLPSDPVIAESGRTGYMFPLTYIPQASVKFKAINNLVIGETAFIEYAPSTPNKYYFRLQYRYKLANGNWSTWQSPNGLTTIKRDGTSFTVPEIIGASIPNANSCLGEMWVGLYLTENSEYGTHIADAYQNVEFTIPVESAPTITSLNMTETDTKIKENFTVFVCGQSKIKIAPIIQTPLSSTLKKVEMLIQGQLYEGEEVIYNVPSFPETSTTQYIEIPINVKAIDSRDNQRIITDKIKAYIYHNPKIINASASFNASLKGVVKLNYNISPINSENAKQAMIGYRVKGTQKFTTFLKDLTNYSGIEEIEIPQITHDHSYDIMVLLKDKITKDTRLVELNRIDGNYIRFITDNLNKNLPELVGPTATIPNERLYKTYKVTIINDTPSSNRIELDQTEFESKLYISGWRDPVSGTTYSLGQSVTITSILTLEPVFVARAEEVTLPETFDVNYQAQGMNLIGFGSTKESPVEYGMGHRLDNIQSNMIIYIKYTVDFTIMTHYGKVIVEKNGQSTAYTVWTLRKNSWEDLDLTQYTIYYEPPGIDNDDTADGESTAEFLGWEQEIPKVYKDNIPLSISANIVHKFYTVRFYDEVGGKLLKEWLKVPYGTGIMPPPNPTIEGKVFRGWSASYTSIKADKNIYGIWDTANIWIMSKNHLWVPYIPQED